MRRLAILALLALVTAPAFAQVVAEADIAREAWYTSDTATGKTPYPVFLHGWNSTPRDDIESYAWDFGDGSPVEHGFAVAHVYTVEGVYTATLTVTGKDNSTSTDTVVITVTTARTNPALYFDADSGSDTNGGLSPATAFKTGGKLATLLKSTALQNRIVYLKRGGVYYWPGDTRPLTGSGGLLITGYGTGADPIIRRQSNTTDVSLFNCTNGDNNRFVFEGIEFDARSDPKPGTVTERITEGTSFISATIALEPGHGMSSGKIEVQWASGFRSGLTGTLSGDTMTVTGGTGNPFPGPGTAVTLARRGNTWDQSGRSYGVAFLDCTFRNHAQGVGVNRPGFETGKLNSIFGTFIIGCTFEDSTNLHTYLRSKYFVIKDSTLRRAGNHGTYGAWMQGAVFHGNTYTENEPSRVCLRVSGASNRADWLYPTQNVSIRNNQFLGTTNGTQYTEYVTEIAPNTTTNKQSIECIEYVGNTVTDGRTLLALGSCENVRVSGNTFSSPLDNGTYSSRIGLALRFNHRPCKNVYITNNTITSNTVRVANPGRTFGFFAGGLSEKPGPDGDTLHRNINVTGNSIVFVPNGTTENGLYFEGISTEQQAEIHTQNYWFIGSTSTPVNRASDKVVGVGTTRYTLDEWAVTGNELDIGEPPPAEPEVPPLDPTSPPTPTPTGRRVMIRISSL